MQIGGDSESDDAFRGEPANLTAEAVAERRSDTRTRTLYRAGLLSNGRESGLCRVRNISDTGIMIATMMKVERGETLRVMLSDTVSLSGRVIWISGARVGLQFLEPVDCAGVLELLAAEQQRGTYRSPRLPVDAVGVATSDRGMQVVRIRNISPQGMQISHDGTLATGMAVKVVLEKGLERRGTVRWANGSLAGLRLAEPFSIEQLALTGGIQPSATM